MPSRLSLLGAFCAAAVVLGGAIPRAVAAGHKGKAVAAKKPPAAAVEPKKELLTDDRAISKQMSWEDKVMGSDGAKKAELAKIARAQAITKAAEAAAAAAPVVKEPPAAAAPKTSKGTVNLLPTVAEEEAKNRKVSPKLTMPEATAPVPPPSKPTDDRFIDKLLTSDGKKKPSVKMSNDHELEQLLTKETEKPGAKTKGKKGKADVVDSVLENAGKTPETPVASKANRTPDWERLEAPATPPPLLQAPVAARKTAKPDDGVIHVVQGANYSGGTGTSRIASPAAKAAEAPARGSNWKDPFADNPAGRKLASAAPAPAPAPAPARAAPAPTPVVAAAPVALRKDSAARADSPGWKDPFAEPAPEHGKPAKRVAAPEPAVEPRVVVTKPEPKAEPKKKAPVTETATRPAAAGWKDPFSEDTETKRADGRQKELVSSVPQAATEEEPVESNKWKVAARRPATTKPAQAVDGRARWSVLKRR